MKYQTKWCEGYYEDEPNNIYSVKIALDSWDEIEDYEDEGIINAFNIYKLKEKQNA